MGAVELRRQAARGVFWSAAGNWGYEVTTLVVVAMLSRLLTPEAFGLVALATIFTALLKLFTEQGLADALVQRAELDPEHLDTAFWLTATTAVILSGILAATSWALADLVGEPDLAPVILALSPVLLLAGLGGVQRAILTRELQFSSLTLRRMTSVIAGGVVGVVGALSGWGVWSLVAQLLTIELVGLLTLWTASDWRPRLRFSRRHLRDLAGFAASVAGFRLLRFLNTRIDNLAIGAVLGATALGFYVVAYRLLELLINATTSIIGTVAFPVISRVQNDLAMVQNAYYKAVRLTSVIAFPAFVGLIFVAPEVTRLTFGDQWDPSIPVTRVLALAGLLNSMTFINGIVMKSLGKPSWRVAIMALTAITLAVAFVLVVRQGIVAVATAFTVVNVAVAPLWLWCTHKLIDLDARRLIRQFVSPLLATAAMAISLTMLRPVVDDAALSLRVAILVSSGAASYLAALWVVGRPLAREALSLGRMAVPKRSASVR